MDLLSNYDDEISNNEQVSSGVSRGIPDAPSLQSEWENFEKSGEGNSPPISSDGLNSESSKVDTFNNHIERSNIVTKQEDSNDEDESHLPPGVRKKNRSHSSSSSSDEEVAKDKAKNHSDSDTSGSGDSDASAKRSRISEKKSETKVSEVSTLKNQKQGHSKKARHSSSSSGSRSRSRSPHVKRRRSSDRRSRSRSQSRRLGNNRRRDSRRSRSKDRRRSKDREHYSRHKESKRRRTPSRERRRSEREHRAGFDRSKRSRSRERSKRSRSLERKKRSRSVERSKRDKSGERDKRSLSKDHVLRSGSKERVKRSGSGERSKRSGSRERSKSVERKKSLSKERRKRRSRSREKRRSRSRESSKRSRERSKRSRSRERSKRSRSWERTDRSDSPREARVIKYGDRVIKAGASFGRPPPSKPMTFKEKMRQQLIKAIEEGGDVSQAFTDKDGTIICTQSAGTQQIQPPKVPPVPLMANLVPLPPGLPAATITASEAAVQSMLALQKETTEKTGVEIPKYYNPAAINPMKYAEQVQKRKLLWSKTKEKDVNSQWNTTSLSSDHDDRSKEKFRKLMGIKQEGGSSTAGVEGMDSEEQDMKQKELFEKLDKEYQFARMTTHTHRGVGLGFGSASYQPHDS